MKYFLARFRFPVAQNDNRHLNDAKDWRIARQFADRIGMQQPLRAACCRRSPLQSPCCDHSELPI
jgi:hypothetical protein